MSVDLDFGANGVGAIRLFLLDMDDVMRQRWGGWVAWLCVMALLAGCQPAVIESLITTPTAVPSVTPTAVLGTPTPRPYSLAGFGAFVARAGASRNADRQAIVNDYLSGLPSHPLVEEGRAAFLWRGPARNVALVGEMNAWEADEAWQMTRFEDTDTWFWVGEVLPEARLDYAFWVDGERLELDGLNERVQVREAGPRSELVMPLYDFPPEQRVALPGVPAERLVQHTLASEALRQTRTFFVYVPPVPAPVEGYATLYVNDGTDYLARVAATAVAEWLIGRGDIAPVLIVFLPPINRVAEYGQSEAYTQFLADELVPFMQMSYGSDAAAGKTAVLGSGQGGTAAIYAGFTRPERFGLVAAHSADLTVDNEGLIRRLRLQEALPVRLHLAVGHYEATNRAVYERFTEVLASKGYVFEAAVRPMGAGWGLWGEQWGAALRHFFGQPVSSPH